MLKLLHWLEVSKSAQNNQKFWVYKSEIFLQVFGSNTHSLTEYLDLGGVYNTYQLHHSLVSSWGHYLHFIQPQNAGLIKMILPAIQIIV